MAALVAAIHSLSDVSWIKLFVDDRNKSGHDELEVFYNVMSPRHGRACRGDPRLTPKGLLTTI